MLSLDDTIVAIASAAGGAARGIIRLSGPQSLAIVSKIFDTALPPNTAIVKGHLNLPAPLGQLAADVYCWPTVRSYTRQPVVEIHTLGSPPILNEVVNHLTAAGARLAEPGEFTLRAFLAGRLDLTQAEAVLGVIDARGRAPLDAALAQLAGGLSVPLHALRSALLDSLAQLEAALDFVDEDIEFISAVALNAQLQSAQVLIGDLQNQLATRATADTLPRVVLVGQPNVGKSSLFNALVGKAAAITSPQAGTTRDYVSHVVEANGVRFELIDTAGVDEGWQPGLAETPDRYAQSATFRQQAAADLSLICIDANAAATTWAESSPSHSAASDHVVVATKCDLTSTPPAFANAIGVSAVTGQGIAQLMAAIAARLGQHSHAAVMGTAERCRESLAAANTSLEHARELLANHAGEELVASEIRAAITELGKIVGAIYTEDLLDRIFSRFCIGK